MSKDTNAAKNAEKELKSLNKQVKATDGLLEKDKKSEKNGAKKSEKKAENAENKSFQDKVIVNIKNFISKIIEMQEKVKQDEEAEKIEKEEEKKRENEERNEEKTRYLLEYYDLPFRYNETVVKILAQTPKRLFVYWDISDKDRNTYLAAFGEHFFEDTYPVLLLHNEEKDYTVEIPINDFANSWYLDIQDPRDKYVIQLGRKFKSYVKPQINSEIKSMNVNLSNDYLFIAISNKLEVPNDHILFEEFKPYVTYKNVKTHEEKVKKLTSTTFADELRKLYGELYDGNNFESGKFDFLNPSSVGTSSTVNWR